MTMVVASQLRAGMAVEYEHIPYRIVAAEYHSGQGKMGGVTHTRLQNLDTGTFRETSFRADLRLQELAVERQILQFLYSDGDQCWFMNPTSCDQVEIPRTLIGPRAEFLEPGLELPVDFVNGHPVNVQFPDVLEVRIDSTMPPLRQAAESAFKPAKLPNGVEVMVPLFIKEGDTIRLDLRTMRYMDRARH